MKTSDFIRLEKLLLPSLLPTFVIKGRLCFAAPLTGTLRGFQFEPSRFNGTDFYVTAFFMPLYVPTKQIHLTFGRRLGGHRWTMHSASVVLDLSAEMQKEQSFLTKLNTPLAVSEALEPLTKRQNPHCHEAFAYSLVLAGQVSAAVKALDHLIAFADVSVTWEQEIASRATRIRGMLLSRPEDARAQLRSWELETARNLGLEEYLESTSATARRT